MNRQMEQNDFRVTVCITSSNGINKDRYSVTMAPFKLFQMRLHTATATWRCCAGSVKSIVSRPAEPKAEVRPMAGLREDLPLTKTIQQFS